MKEFVFCCILIASFYKFVLRSCFLSNDVANINWISSSYKWLLFNESTINYFIAILSGCLSFLNSFKFYNSNFPMFCFYCCLFCAIERKWNAICENWRVLEKSVVSSWNYWSVYVYKFKCMIAIYNFWFNIICINLVGNVLFLSVVFLTHFLYSTSK